MAPKLKSATRLIALAATLASFAVMSADHAESPGADADPAADLADVFIFHSPESASKLVAAITFGGRSAPRSRFDGSFYCDPDVLYILNVDRADAVGAFDNVPDLQVTARFGKNSQGQCGLAWAKMRRMVRLLTCGLDTSSNSNSSATAYFLKPSGFSGT